MSKTFIYALCDPDTKEVRYIGKSDNPKKRLRIHLRQFEKRATHKTNWIKSLIASGKRPALLILEECELVHWQDAERRWIEHYKQLGARLTNTTIGGEGGATVTRATITNQERERRREFGRNRLNKIWQQIRAEYSK